jgi:acetyl-CoA/propionyl-CoA carboxylase biotin carboxyl carrier protein
MKMEHQLLAEVAGTVHLSVTAGQPVRADQVLATIHAGASTESPAAPDSTIQDPPNTGKGA